MVKRLIFALTILLCSAVAAKAFNIVANPLEHGHYTNEPTEGLDRSVEFGIVADAGYEIDQVIAERVVVEADREERYPLEVHHVVGGQYYFYIPSLRITRIEITVTFKKIAYSITIDDGITNGTVEILGDNTATIGDVVSFKVTPDYDFLIGQVRVARDDGRSVSVTPKDDEGNYLFTMPPQNVIIYATFKPVPHYAINIVESPYGTVTSDLETARIGDTVKLTYSSNPGCLLDHVVVRAGYPITGGGGIPHAPAGIDADDLWFMQQEIIPESGDEPNTLYFVLPEEFTSPITPNYQVDTEFIVIPTFHHVSPMAMYFEDSHTLYFTYEANPTHEYVAGETWNGQGTITSIWGGDILTNTGWTKPNWTANDGVTKVVIDKSFASIRPTSCYAWFYLLHNLKTIEGLPNLNTSEVTNMNSMFMNCISLDSINVDTFDMSKVTNTGYMFNACNNLKRIYCDNTWQVAQSEFMFGFDNRLVGAVPFNGEKTDAEMANPNTGYFTARLPITLVHQGLGTAYCPERQFPGLSVEITVNVPLFVEPTIVVTDANNNEIEVVKVEGSFFKYTFVMPNSPVTVTLNADEPEQAIGVVLCKENSTLYFINVPYAEVRDGMYDGHAITDAWYSDMVTNTGTQRPKWSNREDVTKAVIDESFSSVQPTSCYRWFYQLINMTEIEGLEHLNTSAVTNMQDMFMNSHVLTLYVDNFDMSHVTDVSWMFYADRQLTTIFCDNTWNVENSEHMFGANSHLVGAVPYDSDKISCAMANPNTGYFTGSHTIAVVNLGDNVVTVPAKQFPSLTVVFTVESASPVTPLITVTNENGDIIEYTKIDGTDDSYCFVMPSSNVTITLGENPTVILEGVHFRTNNYATWIGETDLALPVGVAAYVVTEVVDDKAVIEAVNYIPANVGVLLYSETPAEIVSTLPYDGATTDVETNMLAGFLEDTPIASGYVLYNDTFVLSESGTLAAHRCYLPRPQGTAGAPSRLLIVSTDGSVVTAIGDVNADAEGGVKYVDIYGRVSDRPFNGVNIVIHSDGSVSKMVR